MEKDGEMNMRKFGMHSQAVAGVIEALLLIAMVAIIISMIQLVYVPQIMKQKEAEHMDQVSNQISMLKSMIDLQGITRSSAPISSMITLGSGGLPYVITEDAQGSLDVNESSAYRIELFPPPGSLAQGIVPLTSIVYEATNFYYVNPYIFILEGGGIILNQPAEKDGKPVMRADPSISSENKTNSITIHFDLPHVIGIIGKKGTGGPQKGNCFIRTNYSSNITYFDTISSTTGGHIRIYSAYPNAWNESLHTLLGIYDVNGYIHINWVSAQHPSYVEIIPGSKDINLQLNVINIYVQIGQGWIL
jgi:competence protein ComGC